MLALTELKVHGGEKGAQIFRGLNLKSGCLIFVF